MARIMRILLLVTVSLALCSAVLTELDAKRKLRPLPMAGYGSCEEPEKLDGGKTFRRCLGPEMPLLPGMTVDANVILANPYPSKKVVVTRQEAQMVERINNHTWRPVPLSELYFHHVVPFTGFLLGQGAETRGTKNMPELPKPYAYMVDGSTTESESLRITNLQLVSILGTPKELTQQSTECWCGFPKQAATKGSLFCCEQSPTLSTEGYRVYQLEYNVTFRDFDDAEDEAVGLSAIDVTGNKIEYNIEEPHGPNTTHTKAIEQALDHRCPQNETYKIVRCLAHQHVGAVCMHVYNAENNEHICSTCPIYGEKEDEPGNELGYVVAIQETDLNPPYEVQPGTKLRVESVYEASKKHLGVMGFFFAYVAGFKPCTPAENPHPLLYQAPGELHAAHIEGPELYGVA